MSKDITVSKACLPIVGIVEVPLRVIVPIVISTKSTTKMRRLRLVLHLLSELSKGAIWRLLTLTSRRRRCMEVRCIGLAEVRCWPTKALLLRRLGYLRGVLRLVLHGVEVSRQTVLNVLVMLRVRLGLVLWNLLMVGERLLLLLGLSLRLEGVRGSS